ncbi:MAG: segregation/condensation protein A [Anaerovoracaceae bacterium]|nr:segregation/condensation protein A [Anaerovoracaceae bacterium]
MGYKVRIEAFEGPFDLLVYLIENARMSIYDIKVAEITSQYIEYLEEMNRVDADVASEFMVLAAELIELKSKMLLPHSAEGNEDAADEDPRSDLVKKLLEYKRFKAVSSMLKDREEQGRCIFEKPQEDLSEFAGEADEILTLSMPQFVAAFNAFIEKKRKERQLEERYQRIQRSRISVEQRTAFIKNLFNENGRGRDQAVNFSELVPDGGDRYDVALSFSTMLEMIRQNRLTASQAALFADIFVKATEHLNDAEEGGGEDAAGPEAADVTGGMI